MTAMRPYVKEIYDKMVDGFKEFVNSDRWKEYLKVMALFHDYSFGNCMLIMAQRQNATMVNGLRKWNALGRSVNAGEKGIVILAPSGTAKVKVKVKNIETGEEEEQSISSPRYFFPVRVFDISQTHGKPVTRLEPERLQGDAPRLHAVLTEVARKHAPGGVTFVVLPPLMTETGGYFKPADRSITINQAYPQLHQCKTLIHETAHARVHELTRVKAYAAGELIAESTAYCVMSALGFDTSQYSFPYLGNYAGQKEPEKLIMAAAQVVQHLSHELIKEIETLSGAELLVCSARAGPAPPPPIVIQPQAPEFCRPAPGERWF